jgi:IclR family transcriptional regulator, KDG regulon repressor
MTLSPKRTYNITSVQRCLRLLGLFSQAHDGLSATEVTKLSGLPVSTVHRFLVNLEEAGFFDCGVSGKYHLGIACFSIGQAALSQLDIRRLSLPYLQALNQHTRETIHLTVRQGAAAVYVEKLDSPEHLRIFSRIGALVPLYCTAVGKVLLAYMPQEERDEILRQMEPRRLTPNTIASRQELEQHLHRVRKAGHAFDLEEHEPHIRCVAAPIWDHTGAVNASLSLTAPAVRMAVPRLRQLAPLIQEAGLRISRDLGYQGSEIGPSRPVPERPASRVAEPLPRAAMAATFR